MLFHRAIDLWNDDNEDRDDARDANADRDADNDACDDNCGDRRARDANAANGRGLKEDLLLDADDDNADFT